MSGGQLKEAATGTIEYLTRRAVPIVNAQTPPIPLTEQERPREITSAIETYARAEFSGISGSSNRAGAHYRSQ